MLNHPSKRRYWRTWIRTCNIHSSILALLKHGLDPNNAVSTWMSMTPKKWVKNEWLHKSDWYWKRMTKIMCIVSFLIICVTTSPMPCADGLFCWVMQIVINDDSSDSRSFHFTACINEKVCRVKEWYTSKWNDEHDSNTIRIYMPTSQTQCADGLFCYVMRKPMPLSLQKSFHIVINYNTFDSISFHITAYILKKGFEDEHWYAWKWCWKWWRWQHKPQNFNACLSSEC